MDAARNAMNTLGARWLRAYANDEPFPALASEAAWHDLVAWAKQNDLLTVLADQIYKLPSTPPALQAEMQAVWLKSAARNAMMLTLASRVLEALRQAQCPVIVLKGAVIAETLYRNIACRAMSDIDLLIPPAHLAPVLAVLTAHQFHYPEHDFVGHTTDYAIQYRGEMHLHSKRLEIDLHWRLFNAEWLAPILQINLDEVWTRACPVHIENAEALQLGGEDALWYLSLHLGLHHAGMQPRMMLDVDRLIRHLTASAFDWDAFTRRCLAFNIAGFVYTALFATQHWLGTPIPSQVMRALALDGWRWQWIKRLTHLDEQLDARVDLARGKDRLLQFITVHHHRERLAMIGYALFPSSDWIAMRYGIQGKRAVWAWRARHWGKLLTAPFRAHKASH